MSTNNLPPPPPQSPPRPQAWHKRLRWKWRDLWHPHRGSGTRPIVQLILDLLSSECFGRILMWCSIGALMLLPCNKVLGMPWPKCLSISGLALDICGVLFVFKEWILQHGENTDSALERVEQRARQLAGKPAETIEPLGEDEPYAWHVAKHIADGERDRLNEHIALALPGIGLLVFGFALQLMAALTS